MAMFQIPKQLKYRNKLMKQNKNWNIQRRSILKEREFKKISQEEHLLHFNGNAVYIHLLNIFTILHNLFQIQIKLTCLRVKVNPSFLKYAKKRNMLSIVEPRFHQKNHPNQQMFSGRIFTLLLVKRLKEEFQDTS